ncbi:uncharacterized protein RCC_10044 [Ramularia collo-cygni]|uniref:Uncharacterized protein n=1 Tax=Ramularia collo-cygni TaxID=112498 RepID=A0A2D3VJ03_9PEZI|nr:uncharacterized protein RCC_10044 [Ramularia collo-cygni]CZT24321.1 uncharacterized protein RCC_10044 [Ramularia collo-cygni]
MSGPPSTLRTTTKIHQALSENREKKVHLLLPPDIATKSWRDRAAWKLKRVEYEKEMNVALEPLRGAPKPYLKKYRELQVLGYLTNLEEWQSASDQERSSMQRSVLTKLAARSNTSRRQQYERQRVSRIVMAVVSGEELDPILEFEAKKRILDRPGNCPTLVEDWIEDVEEACRWNEVYSVVSLTM